MLILLFFLLLVGINLLVYGIKKKARLPIIASVLVFLLFGYFLLINKIEGVTFKKKDAVADLSHLEVVLNDDFSIVKNRVSGFRERIQETTLLISSSDRDRLIGEIESAENYLEEDASERREEMDSLYNRGINKRRMRSYNGSVDNFPTLMFLSLEKESDTLFYTKFEK